MAGGLEFGAEPGAAPAEVVAAAEPGGLAEARALSWREATDERTLRREDPPLDSLTDPHRHQAKTRCTGHHGFAMFECGDVESRWTTQWGKGAWHRESEEPSVRFSRQQRLQSGVQCRRL